MAFYSLSVGARDGLQVGGNQPVVFTEGTLEPSGEEAIEIRIDEAVMRGMTTGEAHRFIERLLHEMLRRGQPRF